MAMRRCAILTAGCIPIFLGITCTSPPRPGQGSVPLQGAEILHRERGASSFAANGTVMIGTGRDFFQGSIDVAADSSGGFNAQWYGPLGIVVATITADSSFGSVIMDNRTFSFRRDQIMDTLTIGWGGDLTFGDLIDIIRGRIPERLSSVATGPYDSLWYKKKAINMRWKTDSIEIRSALCRKTGAVTDITVTVMNDRPWTLTLGKFKEGAAHKIEVKEDDRNYFSLRYGKVRNR
ncbi:MAG: hypothetical protein JXA71_08110 [Chitinispirillaceae bacterium]|nr:hypothetical protein [Chitinispirillaceae bacterium]